MMMDYGFYNLDWGLKKNIFGGGDQLLLFFSLLPFSLSYLTSMIISFPAYFVFVFSVCHSPPPFSFAIKWSTLILFLEYLNWIPCFFSNISRRVFCYLLNIPFTCSDHQLFLPSFKANSFTQTCTFFIRSFFFSNTLIYSSMHSLVTIAHSHNWRFTHSWAVSFRTLLQLFQFIKNPFIN